MAQTGASIQAIADRPEIHKCCRSLEAVVNLLNDYTEAARAVVTLQKKLAKALREAAGLKATGDIPGNTFGASAGLFEVLSDVDGKFAKLVDKECDTVSGEVRKWFKKLAKEEKAHDDKINAANTKIKQAGQSYEKKAKKTAYDAADEHARYIALLSSLGPEVQQEKYNHALTISQRNTSITYTVAGTLARVADAEWLRVSENVRRFAPLIGQVGEWRALCEGGWTGNVPADLPDVVVQNNGHVLLPGQVQELLQNGEGRPTADGGYTGEGPSDRSQDRRPSPVPLYNPPPQAAGQEAIADSARSNPDDTFQADVPPNGTNTPARPEARPATRPGERDREPQSISTSLASFPSPPTHFPIPPVSANSSKPGTPITESPLPLSRDLAPLRDAKGQRASGSSSDASHSSPGSSGIAAAPALSKVDEAPGQGRSTPAGPRNEAVLDTPALTDGPMSPPTPQAETPMTPPASEAYAFPPRMEGNGTQRAGLGINTIVDERADERQHGSSSASSQTDSHLPPPTTSGASTSKSRSSSYNANSGGAFKKGDYLEEREFGVAGNDIQQDQDRTRSLDSGQGKRDRIERSDTMRSTTSGTGSIVAQMRHKYSHSTGPASGPPRDVPRLPLSVSDLANKYQSVASPVEASFSTPTAAPRGRQQTSPGDPRRSYEVDGPSSRVLPTPPAPMDDYSRRRQRIEELEELERREQELELRARERGLELRARERERVETLRGRAGDGYSSDTSRSTQPRPYAQAYPLSQSPQPRFEQPPSLASRHSYSTTSLPQARPLASPALRQFPPEPPSSPQTPQPHPPSCTCPACTVARYTAEPVPVTPAGNALRPPEKKAGWRRRLSMPVIAFANGDAKKKDNNAGMYAAGMGIAGGKGMVPGGGGLERLVEANRSAVSFGRR